MPETRGLCLSEEQTVTSVSLVMYLNFELSSSCGFLSSEFCGLISDTEKAENWGSCDDRNENSTSEIDSKM